MTIFLAILAGFGLPGWVIAYLLWRRPLAVPLAPENHSQPVQAVGLPGTVVAIDPIARPARDEATIQRGIQDVIRQAAQNGKHLTPEDARLEVLEGLAGL